MTARTKLERAFAILILFCLMFFYPYFVVELLEHADQEPEPFGKIP